SFASWSDCLDFTPSRLTGAPTSQIHTLSLHDALPICRQAPCSSPGIRKRGTGRRRQWRGRTEDDVGHWYRSSWLISISPSNAARSEEHTSELQSRENLVCRLLLEKKKEIYMLSTNGKE